MCMIVILMGGNFWGINFFHNGEGLLNIILPFLGYENSVVKSGRVAATFIIGGIYFIIVGLELMIPNK